MNLRDYSFKILYLRNLLLLYFIGDTIIIVDVQNQIIEYYPNN